MDEPLKYLLVEARMLPEIFTKVMQAKMLLSRGNAKNASQAAQMAGISRSAFYKYKDSVFLYDERMNENIVSFSLALEDRPGVLSNLLAQFYQLGANVITVNQNIPIDGVAIASVSIRTADATRSRSQILDMLGKLDGVVEAKSV
ncbi:MAG: ACT domain-containing protein [Oscillospiraceae bacterium]|nr:ACT domain-containing protein [Oscillospiraceae bacterium]